MFDDALREIHNRRYGRLTSHPGWLYAAQIDHRFLDGTLRPLPTRRREPPRTETREHEDPARAAGEHLARLARLDDRAALFAALDELTTLVTPSLTQDSFPGAADADCRRALARHLTGDDLNVVIIGAGPIGLALASALKVAFGARVNVAVVEQRLAAPHHKKPYERRWITAVAHSLLDGLVEDEVSRIFKRIGNDTYIGAPINHLESLLLVSCRRMGVELLFAEGFDLAFLADLPVHAVFDASGNRLRPLPLPGSPADLTPVERIAADRLVLDVPGLLSFGVRLYPTAHDRPVIVGSYHGLYVPICQKQLIKQAMLKVTRIPGRLRDTLRNHVQQHNADNRFYSWPGVLHPEINEVLLIINLEPAEYEALCAGHVFPLSLDEAVAGLPVDSRIAATLQLLAEKATPAERARIGLDAPFLYKPYLVDLPAAEELHGKPLLRVGDSVYNGNVKMANGLGPHLGYVRVVQETLWQAAARRQASAAARAMAVIRPASILQDG